MGRAPLAPLALALGLGLGPGCVGRAGPLLRPPTATLLDGRITADGRPGVTAIDRQGDATGALAVAVTTAGVAPDRGALVGVALAALVGARLEASGISGASAVGGWASWRLRALVSSPDQAARLVDALRAAMLTPVRADDPCLAAVARKVSALAHRPLGDRALIEVARCTGEAFGTAGAIAPTASELEAWRRSAHGLGRVSFATVGDASLGQAAAAALAHGPAWPDAAPLPSAAWPGADGSAVVYDASDDLPAGSARIVVTARTPTPEQAVAAAAVLGGPGAPLASRLSALDSPARVQSIVATAHPEGGCVAATITLGAGNLAGGAADSIATAAALARQEVAAQLADTSGSPGLGAAVVARATDPRDAAERAAWWSLCGTCRERRSVSLSLTVGVSPLHDAEASSPSSALPQSPSLPLPAAPSPSTLASMGAIRSAIDRTTRAWLAPVVEARTRVERGQGETWVLIASPCGTGLEARGDAGAGAEIATATAATAALDASRGSDATPVQVQPFIATDGIGVLAHGAARRGESPEAQARRLADVAARAFAADALEDAQLTIARKALLARASELPSRLRGVLGDALAPGHPSWLDPAGTSFGIASSSDEGTALRAAALRAGPLRVAVLANVDAAQADAAVRAVDRWIARRPVDARSCPTLPVPSPPRSGTYAVEMAPGAPSEVLLAVPLPANDEATRDAAVWTAAMLDGPDGLLARALGGAREDVGRADGGAPAAASDVSSPGPPLAHAWSASVLGEPRAPALVVHVAAPDASLDGAVAQTRALLDRLRHGAMSAEDRARATAAVARDALAAGLDPRERTVSLWRGRPISPPAAPSLEALRTFAATTLRDEALIIVAARPPRLDAASHPPTDRGRKVKLHPGRPLR